MDGVALPKFKIDERAIAASILLLAKEKNDVFESEERSDGVCRNTATVVGSRLNYLVSDICQVLVGIYVVISQGIDRPGAIFNSASESAGSDGRVAG